MQDKAVDEIVLLTGGTISWLELDTTIFDYAIWHVVCNTLTYSYKTRRK